MGIFSWFFKRKKTEEQDEDWEQIIYERDKVNLHDGQERARYLAGCLEQIGEAEKEISLLSGEYSLVTSYLTDMEEIESLPPEQMGELKNTARKIQTLGEEMKHFRDKNQRMAETEYRQISAQENEIEEGIKKLRDAEKMQKLIRQDLTRLDGERHAYEYRRAELENMMTNFKGMTLICVIAFAVCMLLLLLLQFGFEMNTAVGYYISIAAVAIVITVMTVKYMDSEKELERVGQASNKLIQLQNKVKIRYVNNVNLLEYLCLKYNVESAEKLKQLWDMYQAEKEERKQYLETEAKLDYYKEELVEILNRYRVKDPSRWVLQPEAIVDTREMIEIRHGLIVRRQALRKQLDYNRRLSDTAKTEIKDIAAQYPEYAAEISALVEKYEREYI